MAGGFTFGDPFLVGIFLLIQSWPAFTKMAVAFFSTTGFITNGGHPKFGVEASLFGTLVVSVVALVVAVPVALATAIFLNEYAPVRSRRTLIALVDLARPSPASSTAYGRCSSSSPTWSASATGCRDTWPSSPSSR